MTPPVHCLRISARRSEERGSAIGLPAVLLLAVRLRWRALRDQIVDDVRRLPVGRLLIGGHDKDLTLLLAPSDDAEPVFGESIGVEVQVLSDGGSYRSPRHGAPEAVRLARDYEV